MSSILISVKNIKKKFASKEALKGVSFDIFKGEVFGLLGVNGAGKTTTTQMLLGVLKPTSGTIEYFGKNLDAHREEILEKINL